MDLLDREAGTEGGKLCQDQRLGAADRWQRVNPGYSQMVNVGRRARTLDAAAGDLAAVQA